MAVWNTNPKHYGDNDQPLGLLVDRYGNVYVTSNGCQRDSSGSCNDVHERQDVFSAHGRLLLETESSAFTGSDPYGNIYTCSSRRFGKLLVRRMNAAASEWVANYYPLTVDARGRVVGVSQRMHCPCLVVTRTKPCRPTDRFCIPSAPWMPLDKGNSFDGVVSTFALDRSGDIYASEILSPNSPGGSSVADRIAKIAPNGVVRAVWKGFTDVGGIAVGNDGSVYVVDQNSLVKLSGDGKRLAAWPGPQGNHS